MAHGIGINRGASKVGHPVARATYRAEAEITKKLCEKAVEAVAKSVSNDQPEKEVKKKSPRNYKQERKVIGVRKPKPTKPRKSTRKKK